MNIIEQAVRAARGGSAQNQKARAGIATQLERLAQDCAAASNVWKDFLAKPASAGDQWSIVAWVGPARAKQLHEINLAARERMRTIGNLAGGQSARLMDFEEDPIEMAYRQLRPGESGIDAANAAVTKLAERAGLFDRLRGELGKAPTKVAGPAAKKRAKPKKAAKARAVTKKPKAAKKKTKPKRKAPPKK